MPNPILLRILPLAVTIVIAGCGAPAPAQPSPATAPPAATAPGPVPEPTAVPGSRVAIDPGLLVVYETRGGECPDGPCGERTEIYADGTVKYADGPLGVASPELLAGLQRAIEAADWDAILAVPFDGECPVNFDGQEQVYTFNVNGGAVVVASCTTSFDSATEPFSSVQVTLSGPGGGRSPGAEIG
jgi:hypothetical protein